MRWLNIDVLQMDTGGTVLAVTGRWGPMVQSEVLSEQGSNRGYCGADFAAGRALYACFIRRDEAAAAD